MAPIIPPLPRHISHGLNASRLNALYGVKSFVPCLYRRSNNSACDCVVSIDIGCSRKTPRFPSVVSTLYQRLRRRYNVETTLGYRLVLTRYYRIWIFGFSILNLWLSRSIAHSRPYHIRDMNQSYYVQAKISNRTPINIII